MDSVKMCVVGAHLRGQPLNSQLTSRGATFIEQTTTAPGYRLFALPGTVPPKPGMIRSAVGAKIEVEVWELTFEAFGSFVAEIPRPLVIGGVELASGEIMKGFLCEEIATSGAREITVLGGWRAFLAADGD